MPGGGREDEPRGARGTRAAGCGAGGPAGGERRLKRKTRPDGPARTNTGDWLPASTILERFERRSRSYPCGAVGTTFGMNARSRRRIRWACLQAECAIVQGPQRHRNLVDAYLDSVPCSGTAISAAVFSTWHGSQSTWHFANSASRFGTAQDQTRWVTFFDGSMWSSSRRSRDPHRAHALSASHSRRRLATHPRTYWACFSGSAYGIASSAWSRIRWCQAVDSARPEGFEPPISNFITVGAGPLSYGRMVSVEPPSTPCGA